MPTVTTATVSKPRARENDLDTRASSLQGVAECNMIAFREIHRPSIRLNLRLCTAAVAASTAPRSQSHEVLVMAISVKVPRNDTQPIRAVLCFVRGERS